MGLRDWIKSRDATEGGGDTVAWVRPVLDVLEPRLLLDADLTGSQPPPCYELTSHDSALYVDLDQQNAASQTNPSAVLTIDLTPCDGTSQPAPTPGLSDISAGQAGCVAAAEVTGSDAAVVLPDIPADLLTSASLDDGPVSEASPVKIRGPPEGSQEQQALELFSASPALFVENHGQWSDSPVRYVHNGSRINVAITGEGVLFGATDTDEQMPLFSASFVGANAVRPVGLKRSENALSQRVDDQASWRENMASHGLVTYAGGWICWSMPCGVV